MDLWTAIILFVIASPTVLSTIVGTLKGRGVTGFFLGLFLSWIGFIITLCLSSERARERRHEEMLTAVGGYRPAVRSSRVRCPHCRARVDENAKFCPECGWDMNM